jgi:undecaprenyl-diphosphatase
MWPGMSRSMVTIVGGYMVGLSARAAAEFSFMLGLLTLTAASTYSLLGSWDVLESHLSMGPALVGILVATLVAFIAVKWFVSFLGKHGLFWFAIYRLVLCAVILWVFMV